jgi:hypothetical protein
VGASGALSAQTPAPAPAVPAQPAEAAAPAAPTQVFSGLMFGDYYYIAQNHRASIEKQHGFWMRRVFFTFDHGFSKSVTARVRLEMNSPGDFTSRSTLTPYVKDAYIRMARGRHSLTLGIQPTPTYEVVDALWGYRPVEKSLGDLQGFEATRDFGVGLAGPLTRDGRVSYVVQYGNGSNVGGEADQSKSVRGSVVFRARSGYLVEGYADYQDKPGEGDYFTWKALAGRSTATYRIGAEFYQQGRRNAAGTATENLEALSVFGALKLDELWVFGRVDRMFDPNLAGEKITWVPFSDEAKSTYLLGGVDLTVQNVLHVMPNVSFIRYDEPEQGARPDSDVQARLTFYFRW